MSHENCAKCEQYAGGATLCAKCEKEAVENLKSAIAALSQKKVFPADVTLAKARIKAVIEALEKKGGRK